MCDDRTYTPPVFLLRKNPAPSRRGPRFGAPRRRPLHYKFGDLMRLPRRCAPRNDIKCRKRMLAAFTKLFHIQGNHVGFYGIAVSILDHAVDLTALNGGLHGNRIAAAGGAGLAPSGCASILDVPSVA